MKKIATSLITVLSIGFICSCAGHLEYTHPTPPSQVENMMVVDKSKDAVWSELVPALAKNFFVINNIDKTSGLINISYSGDPERYIDCGEINSFVQNAQGKRNYQFPAAKANQTYEVMEGGMNYAKINREMNLDGRMNIIIESLEPAKTRVTVSTKYVVTRKAIAHQPGRYPQSFNDTISFNTGGSAAFPQGTTCCCTGSFENAILSLLKP